MPKILGWLEKQAPDVGATFRRFPLAIAFTALCALTFIILINDWIKNDHEMWVRLGAGLVGAAIYALAGSLFMESRSEARSGVATALVAYGLPIVVLVALQISDTTYLSAPMLLVVGPFWLSVSAFTAIGNSATHANIQNRFWWLNHQVVTTGVVAGVGFALVCLGTVAIERSLDILFGLSTADIIYRFILPLAGLFLTPIYWFSTIPKLDEFKEGAIDNPDFLSRAIGFLGQFILAPLLLIYALILLAYTLQIIITGALPNGLLGWMVLVFTITGAVTWLVLHPRFMHQRPLVRLFRRSWFWLTIVPIGLYALAVWQRVDAYGLTVERVLLVAGGLWAGLLTVAFLSRRAADIRLIPALAGGLFLILGLGPWNLENLSRWSQSLRLDEAAQLSGLASGSPNWQPDTAAQARGALIFLQRNNGGEQDLANFFAHNSIEIQSNASRDQMIAALQLPETSRGTRAFSSLMRQGDSPPVSITGTPYMFTEIDIYPRQGATVAGLNFVINGSELDVFKENEKVGTVSLADWLATQGEETLIDPAIDFTIGASKFRLVVTHVSIRNPDEGPVEVQNIRATLFASEPTLAD